MHHKRKKFREYFFEFIMIFLAVTLGFLADNIRENRVNREMEKQAIESLLKCLANDTARLRSDINANLNIAHYLNELVSSKNAHLNTPENRRFFLINSCGGFTQDWYFKTNDAALQQLKSNGVLKLIHKQNIIDSIFKYEQINTATVAQEADCYYLFKECLTDFRKVVDLSFLEDTNQVKFDVEYDNVLFRFKNIDAILIDTTAPEYKHIFGNAATLSFADNGYAEFMQNQLDYGRGLIYFLKKEYKLQ